MGQAHQQGGQADRRLFDVSHDVSSKMDGPFLKLGRRCDLMQNKKAAEC
jgi:hypothetical protein